MSDLFQTTTRNIELHTQDAFSEGELDEEATAKESFVVRSEGGRQVRRRNKRTASLLFVDYLRRNDALLGTNGQPRFSNSACARRSSSSRRRSDCSGETSIS